MPGEWFITTAQSIKEKTGVVAGFIQ